MKKFASIALIATAMAVAAAPRAAFAEDEAAPATLEVKRGAMLYNAEGGRVGNVYRASSEGDAMLIYRGRMITISASTLSEVDGKLTTSLTRKEIAATR